mmetsp:Transcript_30649/g.52339  ORF Transcript_30649/g.52339 Transcript_30649/m.52339 type:complete len:134 (-) Transcript_30649:164-565(-)
MRRVHHFARGQFAPRYGIVFADLHHVVDRIGGQVVERYGGDGGHVFETEVDVGGGEAVDVEPNVSGPAILDEMFILMLVSSDITNDVLRREVNVRVFVEALSSSDGIIEYHRLYLYLIAGLRAIKLKSRNGVK